MWRKLLGLVRKKTSTAAAAPRKGAPELVLPPPPPREALLEGSAWEHLEALGVELPVQCELTPADLLKDEELSKQILEHYRANKPAPSSLPAVSLQVLNAVAKADLSLADLSRLASQDPGLTAGILKVANSPAYAGTQEIESLRDAVTRLGLVEVGRVAGTVAARSLFQPQVRAEFSSLKSAFDEVFAQSVAGARGAAHLAMQVKHGRADHAFLSGILHDLGRSVALRSVAALAAGPTKLALGDASIMRAVELAHIEIGSEVHDEWSLPRLATLVTVRHHDLNLPTNGEYVGVHVVRLCSTLAQVRGQPWRVAQAKLEVDESCRALELDGFQLRAIDTVVREELAHYGIAFSGKAPVKASVRNALRPAHAH